MVARSYKLHKIFFYHIGILAVHGTLHIGIHNTLRRNLIFNIVIHKLRVVLCADTCERFTLCLWNTESFKGVLYIFRHVFPIVLHFCVGANICRDISYIKSVKRRSPIWHLHLVIYLQGLKTELLHPNRIVFLLGELVDNFGSKSALHTISVVLLIAYIIDAAVNVFNLTFLFHL